MLCVCMVPLLISWCVPICTFGDVYMEQLMKAGVSCGLEQVIEKSQPVKQKEM